MYEIILMEKHLVLPKTWTEDMTVWGSLSILYQTCLLKPCVIQGLAGLVYTQNINGWSLCKQFVYRAIAHNKQWEKHKP